MREEHAARARFRFAYPSRSRECHAKRTGAHARRSPTRRPVRGHVQIPRSNACRTWCDVQRYRARSSGAPAEPRGCIFSLSFSLSFSPFLSFSFSLRPSAPSFCAYDIADLATSSRNVRLSWCGDDGEIRPPLSSLRAGVGDRHARDALRSGHYHHVRRREPSPLVLQTQPTRFTRKNSSVSFYTPVRYGFSIVILIQTDRDITYDRTREKLSLPRKGNAAAIDNLVAGPEVPRSKRGRREDHRVKKEGRRSVASRKRSREPVRVI